MFLRYILRTGFRLYPCNLGMYVIRLAVSVLGACCRLVSFPDPTQLSVACSMEKCEESCPLPFLMWALHDQKMAKICRKNSVLHIVQLTTHSIFSILTSLMWEKIPGHLLLFSYCKQQKAGWELGGYCRLVLFLYNMLSLVLTYHTQSLMCYPHL